jgi:hypothetical protein
MLGWLPECYGPTWGEHPPFEALETTDTKFTALRIPNDVLERIDAAVSRTGLNRQDYILRWQPEYYHRETALAEFDPDTDTREV